MFYKQNKKIPKEIFTRNFSVQNFFLTRNEPSPAKGRCGDCFCSPPTHFAEESFYFPLFSHLSWTASSPSTIAPLNIVFICISYCSYSLFSGNFFFRRLLQGLFVRFFSYSFWVKRKRQFCRPNKQQCRTSDGWNVFLLYTFFIFDIFDNRIIFTFTKLNVRYFYRKIVCIQRPVLRFVIKNHYFVTLHRSIILRETFIYTASTAGGIISFLKTICFVAFFFLNENLIFFRQTKTNNVLNCISITRFVGISTFEP